MPTIRSYAISSSSTKSLNMRFQRIVTPPYSRLPSIKSGLSFEQTTIPSWSGEYSERSVFALQTGSVRINISVFCKMSESSKLEVKKYLIFYPVITKDEFALDVTQFGLQSCLRALYRDLNKIAPIRCIPTWEKRKPYLLKFLHSRFTELIITSWFEFFAMWWLVIWQLSSITLTSTASLPNLGGTLHRNTLFTFSNSNKESEACLSSLNTSSDLEDLWIRSLVP